MLSYIVVLQCREHGLKRNASIGILYSFQEDMDKPQLYYLLLMQSLVWMTESILFVCLCVSKFIVIDYAIRQYTTDDAVVVRQIL